MEATATRKARGPNLAATSFLAAAASLVEAHGAISFADLAAALNVSMKTVDKKVRALRKAAMWPYDRAPAVRSIQPRATPATRYINPAALLEAAAKLARPGDHLLFSDLSRATGWTRKSVSEHAYRLHARGLWPYLMPDPRVRTRPQKAQIDDAELAERIANRPLPTREHHCDNGRIVVHHNPGPHPDEVDDPRVHGWFAAPRSVNAPHHKAPKTDAQVVAGYVRECKAIRRRHRKAVWA